MTRTIPCYRAIIVLSAMILFCSSVTATPSDEKTYTRQWQRVDSLEKAGLPKSALETVNAIYQLARDRHDNPQQVKAVIWKLKLEEQFREDFPGFATKLLLTETLSAGEPLSSIYRSLLGEVYWNYYNQNNYRFAGRSATGDERADSIQTWDPGTITAHANTAYLSSLSESDILKKIPVTEYAIIMESQTKEESAKNLDPTLRPTLYDFLLQRALAYFTASDNMKDPVKGFPSKHEVALNLFADAAAFHLNDAEPRVYISYELDRLAYLHENSGMGENDTVYSKNLSDLEKRFNTFPASASVSFARASYLVEQGNLYKPLVSQQHQFDLVKALDICQKTLKKYPKEEGSRNCQELAASVRRSSLNVTTPAAVYPDKKFPALVTYKNLTGLWFRLISIDPEEYHQLDQTMKREDILKFLCKKYFVKAWSQVLPSDSDYQQHSVEIIMPDVPAGYYVVLGSADKDFSDVKAVAAFHDLWVTRISYFNELNNNQEQDIFVLDRETGKPMKEVSAEAYTRDYNYRTREWKLTKIGDYTTDENGFFTLPHPKEKKTAVSVFLKLRTKNDLFITQNLYLFPQTENPEKTLMQTNFYTDRAVYRPGQTIWFKGIVMEKRGETYALKTGYPTRVVFRDVNNREIAATDFTTNEFGSFNGSFIAPSGVLTGMMTISNESGSVSVSVEEYRRPTFEVTFDPVEGNYKLGKTVTVKGKAIAYAGNNLDGARVSYRVVRTARFPYYDWFWYRPIPNSEETEIINGTTTTGSDGAFTISFSATPDISIPVDDQPVFDFMIYADITDLNGETQSGTGTVSAGYVSLVLGSSLGENFNMATDSSLVVTATNLNGAKTPCEVKVSLQRLKQPDRAYIPRLWGQPDLTVMSRREFHTDLPYDIYDGENNPATWPVESTVLEQILHTATDSLIPLRFPGSGSARQGSYKLILTTTDPFGQQVEKVTYFTAFDPSAKEMPARMINWFIPLKTSAVPGEKVSFLVGSTEDDVNIICQVIVHDTIYSLNRLKVSDRQTIVEVPVEEGFRGNFSVSFIFAKHNRIFQNHQLITVPWSNKKLDIVFETFRDKITPGAKEEWKVRITGPEKKIIPADFLATMYDASLDAFREHSWSMSIFPSYYRTIPWDNSDGFGVSSGSFYGIYESAGYKFRETDRLNWFGNVYTGGGKNFRGRFGAMDLSSAVSGVKSTAPVKLEETMTIPSSAKEQAMTTSVTTKSEKATPPASVMQVRRDFRETAFFFPSLVTDSTGALVLKFTAPESLTRWRLMGMAITKNLDYGMTEKYTVTRKELMVTPNPPRFVRQGDTLIFSAKVVNLSGADQDCRVEIHLTDPVSGQSLNSWLAASSAQVLIPKGSASSVTFRLTVPADAPASLLQYRITASAGIFSDGEEKIIPVLPNRMMVTETLPLPVRGKGTFHFTFDKLAAAGSTSSTLKNYRLTLEFTSNPVWYAIQALPSLNEVTFQSADNIFDAWYSNALASFITASHPKIRGVIESWRQLTPNALLSNLEKNEDLKSALLQETPWVMEAKDESANKQKLGLYFEKGALADRMSRNMTLLRDLQQPDGSWPWFKGMPGNRWVTQEIVTGFGRLHHLGVTTITKDPATLEMIRKAVLYLDRELVDDYHQLKTDFPDKMDENHLSSIQVQYLYALSFFRDPAFGIQHNTPDYNEALDYFTRQAAKYWLSQDLMLQGMIAVALNRSGDLNTPSGILKSLNEKSLSSAEMGKYWAIRPGYFWSQTPVETQVMLIEAFDEVNHDRQAVDEMNVWLLKQKQTQLWKSNRATVDACYALLLRGADRLAEDPQVKIRLGKEEINPSNLKDNQAEAGTGYFRMSWNGSEITPEMAQISVTKSSEGVAWGGLYWQYFENADKVTSQQSPLKVSREVLVERNTPNGPALYSLSDTNILQPGDKVKVRIVLSVDRDLEFVHMKDMRSAGLEPPVQGSPESSRITSSALSGYRYQDGLGYYQAIGDLSAGFFFDRLPKGTHVFEYPLKANNAGNFSNGITTVQCMYAPEFSAHSEGLRVAVK
ncbi:MAG TPA: alpha-2-macroglobulin family protein [Bacteroidales bacterium]|nr:alpha-2-macroglobulin family protein [Bacteroidales bacterium]